MAEGESSLRGCRSVEEMNTSKPGKLSSDLLSKFESDPALTRPGSYPSVNVTNRLSADDLVPRTSSVGSPMRGNTRISFSPNEEIAGACASGSTEDVLSEGETENDPTQSKKKSRWKWHPLRKMRKLFSRKKNPSRTKSFEDVKGTHYKHSSHFEEEEEAELGPRTKSDPFLPGSISMDHLVQRTHSTPPKKGGLMQELRHKQRGSHDDTTVEEGMETKAVSLPSLNWSLVQSSNNGSEAAISFDSLPSASSLEGLQAAHDKIKVAPKHRRPPRKARTRTSSGRAVKEPPHKMLHKRSNTVPEDLLGRSEDLLGSVGEADRHGSLVSRTIFESAEIGEDEVVSPTPSPVPRSETSSKDTAADSAIVRAQIEARATELVAKAKVSPKPRNRQKQGLAKPTGVVEETSKDVRETQGSSESLTTKEKDAKDLTTILKEPQEKGEKEKNSDHQKITDQAKKLVKRKEALKSPGDNQPASHVGGEKVNDFRGPHPKSSETVDTPLEETAVPTNESVTRAAPPTTEPVTKPADAADKPDWIALAQKKSKRVSQLLETADTQSEEANQPQDTTVKSEPIHERTASISSKMKKLEKPKTLPFKPVTNVESSAGLSKTLPRPEPLQKPTINRSYSEYKPKIATDRSPGKHSSLRGFQCDKCIVCGTNVYQTERCCFDNTVLHRHCIKCSVCNRLLTIGNFVVSESKIYCKPHVGQVVPVSM